MTSFWTSVLVAMAYLPDIANQLARFVSSQDQTRATHSLLFAFVASTVIGTVMAIGRALPFYKAVVISLISIFGHDMLDLLQSSGRQPLWPLSRLSTPDSWQIIPNTIVAEIAIFGGIYLVVLAVQRGFRRHVAGRDSERIQSHLWFHAVPLVCILSAALGTHYLREIRERDFASARSFLEQKNFAAALVAAEEARPWPSTARPGRVEYFMAEAHLGLGDRPSAEALYLASFKEDPHYFWCIADLAVFYASGPEPLKERRCRVLPLLDILTTQFQRHPDRERLSTKIDQYLKTE